MREASGPRALTGRLRHFFGSDARGRGEVAALLGEIAGIGRAAAVGGLPRDLLLAGNRAFSSDVDLVIDAPARDVARLAMARHGRPNRFGGHALSLGTWHVDVWALESTWAHVEGHVEVGGIPDVLRTTFFDWDAVAYDVPGGRLICGPDYFERVRGRSIEINLAPNPNPFGNAVRAARYAIRWDARFGPALAEHVARHVRDRGWEEFLAYEEAGYGRTWLRGVDPEGLGTGRPNGQASFNPPRMTA